MNPTDGLWWWQYGLDGVIGGIAGGVVAWFAVWLTLRGTRSQGQVTDAELAVARLQAAGIRVMLTMSLAVDVPRALRPDRILSEVGTMATALAETRVRVLHR